MKVESDMCALSEVDPICMNTDEAYVPSDFSIIKMEPEVSLVLRLCVIFWAFPRRLIIECRRFGTLYLFHLQRLVMRCEVW
jgi:hypothetical protein